MKTFKAFTPRVLLNIFFLCLASSKQWLGIRRVLKNFTLNVFVLVCKTVIFNWSARSPLTRSGQFFKFFKIRYELAMHRIFFFVSFRILILHWNCWSVWKGYNYFHIFFGLLCALHIDYMGKSSLLADNFCSH